MNPCHFNIQNPRLHLPHCVYLGDNFHKKACGLSTIKMYSLGSTNMLNKCIMPFKYSLSDSMVALDERSEVNEKYWDSSSEDYSQVIL